jgi:hypothetical protein
VLFGFASHIFVGCLVERRGNRTGVEGDRRFSRGLRPAELDQWAGAAAVGAPDRERRLAGSEEFAELQRGRLCQPAQFHIERHSETAFGLGIEERTPGALAR